MTSSKQDMGVPPSGSGHSQSGAAISGASPAEPSVPNAARGFNPTCIDPDILFCDLAEEGAAAGLLALMTGISEEYWCAGWMSGLEYSLWDRRETGPSQYGQGFVTERQCNLLRLLAEEAGGWWAWNHGPVFLKTADWLSCIAEIREAHSAAIAIEAATAGETTKIGSTEGESAGPKDIAQKGSQ